MGNITTANESDPEALESYFTRYPDVPKETILKQHLLSLGHWFSDAALDAAAGALVKSYRLFSYDLVPMSEFKRNEHRRVPEHFVILNGPYGMRPVSIQTSLSPSGGRRPSMRGGGGRCPQARRKEARLRAERRHDHQDVARKS